MRHLVLLLAFTLMLPGMSSARQITYVIKGTIKNYKHCQKVYLMHFVPETLANGSVNKNAIDGSVIVKALVDSTIVVNGAFIFKGKADISNEPDDNYTQARSRILLDHSGKGISFPDEVMVPVDGRKSRAGYDGMDLYLENGVTELTVVDSISKAIIIPPKLNDGHYTLDSIYTAFYIKSDSVFKRIRNLAKSDPKSYMRMNEKYHRKFMNEQKKDEWLFIKDHPNSPVSLYILQHMEDNYPDYDKIAPYFDALSPDLKETEFGKSYAATLADLKLIANGAIAPDFIMDDTAGKPVSLSSFRGKYVLLDFWASWCKPCRVENPLLVKAYEQFKGRNFNVVGVSLEKQTSAWLKAIKEDRVSWTQLSDLREWSNAAAKLYSVSAIPQNFLIGPNGRIIAKNLFGKRLINRLDKILP